jgi:glyoxylase-like metal-dependent hydrolase (beta-lactamase superfamily II)
VCVNARVSAARPSDPQALTAADGDASPERSEAQLLAPHEILRVLAPNPGPLSLAGTNTWLIARDPTWVVDPGPLIESHTERVLAAVEERGGLGGVALTHDHLDHSQALDELLAAHPAPLAAGRAGADVQLADGVQFGPLHALATPGHAPDHFALCARGACFTGDAVLGEGTVFISPYPGAMSSYMRALERLRALDLDLLCPGHGPLVRDPARKLDEYLEHRRERERNLIAALAAGRRSAAELLDAVWSDVPAPLRGAAGATLAAHLDKLEQEQRLPAGVERPRFEPAKW